MWQHRGMRLIFLANLVSMIGSGMNSAAVIWYILQATHSEVSLGLLIALQTIPSMLLLPFTGVLIDREDRRHLMMWLDSARGAIILFIAVLVFTHHVQLWHLYAMNVLVAIGFWMFFPTVNALIQELTPGRQDGGFERAVSRRAAGRLAAGGRGGRLRLQPHRPGRRAADRLRQLCDLHCLCFLCAKGTGDCLASRTGKRRESLCLPLAQSHASCTNLWKDTASSGRTGGCCSSASHGRCSSLP